MSASADPRYLIAKYHWNTHWIMRRYRANYWRGHGWVR